MAAIGKKLGELNDIIIALRKPDGCPWDRKQTPQTFKSYLLEESHELLEAIDADDPGLVKEELGDMLFQILFINLLYEEKGLFTLQDVISTISDKMVRRHPHVFGGEKVQSEADQRLKWNQIKAREKKTRKKAADLLFGVPLSLPGLRRAQRVSERAAHNGFEWQDLAPTEINSAGQLAYVGGDKYVQFNAELRFPLIEEAGVIGLVFFDTGEVYAQDEPVEFGQLRKSAGFGFRWFSPMGPIRLENAYILDPKEGESSGGKWEFSMGGAF